MTAFGDWMDYWCGAYSEAEIAARRRPRPEGTTMTDRLPPDAHQTARQLARDADALWPTDPAAAVRKADELRALIRRDLPDLGERFLCPSGQTAGRFEDAQYAWTR